MSHSDGSVQGKARKDEEHKLELKVASRFQEEPETSLRNSSVFG